MLENSTTLRITAITSLVILVLITPLLTLFHDDTFYDFAYQKNNVYTALDKEIVWSVTENFQAYLVGKEELVFFQEDQTAHLHDVKELYSTGRFLWVTFFILTAFSLIKLKNTQVFVSAAKISGIILAVLAMLALNWEWFFLQFHKIFFEGNYLFSPATLMLRLWGGNFFLLAAIYAFVQSLVLSIFFYVLGKVMLRLHKNTDQ